MQISHSHRSRGLVAAMKTACTGASCLRARSCCTSVHKVKQRARAARAVSRLHLHQSQNESLAAIIHYTEILQHSTLDFRECGLIDGQGGWYAQSRIFRDAHAAPPILATAACQMDLPSSMPAK